MESRVALEMDPGEKYMRLIYMEEDEIKGLIEFDLISNRIEIKGLDDISIISDQSITMESPRILLLGDVEVDGEIKHWGGDKLTFMDNDMEPYGTQTRNYWPYDLPMAPYHLGSASKFNETKEYK